MWLVEGGKAISPAQLPNIILPICGTARPQKGKNAGLHINPFLIPKGIGVESRGMKVNFICLCELLTSFCVRVLHFINMYCIWGVQRCKY